jgi:hypothetical protein
LNFDYVFSSFYYVSLGCAMNSANLKNRGIQVHARIQAELETALQATLRDEVADERDERGWRGMPVR